LGGGSSNGAGGKGGCAPKRVEAVLRGGIVGGGEGSSRSSRAHLECLVLGRLELPARRAWARSLECLDRKVLQE
jgi:hypothetical protein